jgi:hypothetical protein
MLHVVVAVVLLLSMYSISSTKNYTTQSTKATEFYSYCDQFVSTRKLYH